MFTQTVCSEAILSTSFFTTKAAVLFLCRFLFKSDSYLTSTGTVTKLKSLSLIRQLPIFQGKGKGKVHPRTCHEGKEWEWRYCSTLSLTLALDGVGG